MRACVRVWVGGLVGGWGWRSWCVWDGERVSPSRLTWRPRRSRRNIRFKSQFLLVTFPKVIHPVKKTNKRKRQGKNNMKKKQKMKQQCLERKVSTKLHFRVVQCGLVSMCSRCSTAPTPKRRRTTPPTREREEANNTQKKEGEISTTQEGKTTENSTKDGRRGKTTPPQRSEGR